MRVRHDVDYTNLYQVTMDKFVQYISLLIMTVICRVVATLQAKVLRINYHAKFQRLTTAI